MLEHGYRNTDANQLAIETSVLPPEARGSQCSQLRGEHLPTWPPLEIVDTYSNVRSSSILPSTVARGKWLQMRRSDKPEWLGRRLCATRAAGFPRYLGNLQCSEDANAVGAQHDPCTELRRPLGQWVLRTLLLDSNMYFVRMYIHVLLRPPSEHAAKGFR